MPAWLPIVDRVAASVSLMGAIVMGRRDDSLQRKLHALLIPIIAGVFVLAMGELRYWFVGLVFGVVLGFLGSGAIVWFRVDVLNQSLDAHEPRVRVHGVADPTPLGKAMHYLDTCGELTLPKAIRALRIARQMDLKQSLLNTWATHKPSEVREFLREQFAAILREKMTAVDVNAADQRPVL
jgi:hypothetical protein